MNCILGKKVIERSVCVVVRTLHPWRCEATLTAVRNANSHSRCAIYSSDCMSGCRRNV